MRFGRIGNWMFSFGLIGWLVCTYLTPKVIKILFTPPVSFGTNCEPAADWSMDKLIQTQTIGIVCFMIVGFMVDMYLRRRNRAQNLKNANRLDQSK